MMLMPRDILDVGASMEETIHFPTEIMQSEELYQIIATNLMKELLNESKDLSTWMVFRNLLKLKDKRYQ